MTMGRWQRLGLALVGVFAVALWFATKRSWSDSVTKTVAAPHDTPIDENGLSEKLDVHRIAETGDREPASPASISRIEGTVRSSQGKLVSGASVELVWLMPEDRDQECAWQDDDWGSVDRERQTTETDLGGGFSIDLHGPEGSLGALVSASHVGHEASALVLHGEPNSWSMPIELILDSAEIMTVMVIDGEGSPVSGAKVEQFGLAPPGVIKGAAGLDAERSLRLLQRAYTASLDGSVDVAVFPGSQVLVARKGDDASLPWRGMRQPKVTLRLVPTFEVGGTVSMPTWEHLNYVGERRITIAAQTRNLWRTLDTIRSVVSGPWGPVRLPRVDADRYRVRLEGSPIIPVEWFFAPPAPGASLQHALVTDLGTNVWFRVADEDDHVIPSAKVRVQWQASDDPDHWNFVERTRNESDQINVWSLPPDGSFKYSAFAPGYVPFFSNPVPTSLYEKQYAPITLQKAARLRGVCSYQGKPADQFEVVVWQPNAENATNATAFFDRSDGTFELDDVPTGEFWVAASSPLTPACEPIAVSAAPGETVEVRLELLDGLLGRGRVLDQATGLPLGSASIQLFVKGNDVPSARWGLPIPVGPDGAFEFRGFLPGNNYIRTMAAGYSNEVTMREAGAAGDIDFGDVLLSHAQDFTILLEPPDRAEGARVVTRGTQLPGKTFSNGTVVYRSVSAGAYGVTITEADDSEAFVELDLVPGADWTLRTQIGGPNDLFVRVVSDKGSAMSQIGWIEVSYQSSQGFRTLRTKFPRGRDIVEFEGIDADTVTVQAFDENHVPTTAGGTFSNGRLDLDLKLTSERFLLTVVDARGEPIPDVRVIALDPQQPGFHLFGGTDAQGTCELRGVPPHQVLINLQHESRGSHFGIPVDASSGFAEVALDGGARLDLQFLDGSTRLSGVTWSIVDFVGASLAYAPTSDEGGRATLSNLAPDTYSLRAARPDCWPIEFKAEARREEGPTTPVQMRQLGNVGLQVTAVSGLPIAEVAVQLTSLEFDAEVSSWIEGKLVRSAGLMTDRSGRIRVEGLPHGPYRWRATNADGEIMEGRFEVQPGADSVVRILLP